MPDNPFEIAVSQPTTPRPRPASTNPFDQANTGAGFGIGAPQDGGLLSAVAPVLDFLSRGQYASAGFFDALINDDASIGDALSLAASELVSPTRRKSFTDVLRRSNPDFVANNPTSAKVIGFLGDIALDPTTYLGFGLGAATKGARIGGRALTGIGEAYQAAARSGLAGREIVTGLVGAGGRAATREAGEVIGREQLTRLPGAIGRAATFETAPAGELLARTIPSVGADIRAALGGKLPAGVTNEALDDLATKISLERLGLPSVEAAQGPLTVLMRERSTGEAVEAADQMIARIAGLSPEASASIFKPGGLRLSVGVPFTKAQAEIPIINRNILRAVGLDKLEGLVKVVGELPGIKQALNGGRVLRGAIDRFYELPQSYIGTITKLQNEYDFIKQDVVRDAIRLAGDIPREGRERISKVMASFEGALEGLDDAQRLQNAPTAFQMAARATPLQPQEQAVVMSLIQGYSRASELERALGVAAQGAANFDPRVFQALANSASEAVDWLKRIGPDGVDAAGLDAKGMAKAADIASAVADGANPAQDAVLLYAQRVIQARQRLPRIQADAALKAIFGTSDPAKLPKRVANDWRYYGEFRFPTFVSDEANDILSAVDWLQRKWKGLKTVVNPSFAPRQAVSNSIASAMALGNDAARAFDPRSYSAAAHILWGNRPAALRKELPETVSQWLSRFTDADELPDAQRFITENLSKADEATDLAKGLEITTPTGQKYSREEIDLLARQNGIIRGTGGFSGEVLRRSLQEEIGTGARASLTGKALDGTKALVDGYVGLASKVEDTSRLALFINSLNLGDSPTLAAQRVNRALFDYSRSFSRFEQEVVKRLVPFYSYQRLAVPFVLKETLANPGAPATLNKVADLIGTLLTGDEKGNPATLTQAQREIFGRSFLVEQPRVFKGFDKDGRALFDMFNSLTPFDVLSLGTVTKQDGQIDWQRTAEKTIFMRLTPFLKIPAEVIANRDFFTDKVISDARGYGGAGRLGAIKDKALDLALPEPIKAAIGWEWGRDLRTGEQIAYVNPYLAYTMGQLAPPVANLFVKPLKESESVLDRSIRILTGVSEQQVDFKKSLDIQNSEDKRFIQELRQKVVAAQRTGRKDSLSQALEEYRNVLRAVAERRARTASLGQSPQEASVAE